tara:strand:- start:698 stop:1555 length:858 start_codon:yes stop_codon:yes gene_type:complete
MKAVQIVLSALAVFLFFFPWIRIDEELVAESQKAVKSMSKLIQSLEKVVEESVSPYDRNSMKIREAQNRLSDAEINLEIWEDLNGMSGYDLASEDPWYPNSQGILFLVPFLAFAAMLVNKKFVYIIYPIVSFACLWYAYKDKKYFDYDIGFWCLNADLFIIFVLGIAMPMPISREEKRRIQDSKKAAAWFGIPCTDSAVKPFGGFSTLTLIRNAQTTGAEKLNLQRRGISNITPLMKLKSVKELHLGGNPLNAEQVNKLKNALPNCRVDFSTPKMLTNRASSKLP